MPEVKDLPPTIKTKEEFIKAIKAFSPTGKGICLDKLDTGVQCGNDPTDTTPIINGDWQCNSGRCKDNKCVNPDSLLGLNKGPCIIQQDCTSGLWCDFSGGQGVCRIAKKINLETCSKDSECGTPGEAFCNRATEKCVRTLATNNPCSYDRQCSSLWCKESLCKANVYSENQLTYFIQKPEDFYKSQSSFDVRKWISEMFYFIILSIIIGIVLPLINFLLLSRAAKDISGFIGGE